jgi:hypothetical protein
MSPLTVDEIHEQVHRAHDAERELIAEFADGETVHGYVSDPLACIAWLTRQQAVSATVAPPPSLWATLTGWWRS